MRAGQHARRPACAQASSNGWCTHCLVVKPRLRAHVLHSITPGVHERTRAGPAGAQVDDARVEARAPRACAARVGGEVEAVGAEQHVGLGKVGSRCEQGGVRWAQEGGVSIAHPHADAIAEEREEMRQEAHLARAQPLEGAIILANVSAVGGGGGGGAVIIGDAHRRYARRHARRVQPIVERADEQVGHAVPRERRQQVGYKRRERAVPKCDEELRVWSEDGGETCEVAVGVCDEREGGGGGGGALCRGAGVDGDGKRAERWWRWRWHWWRRGWWPRACWLFSSQQ